RQAISSPARHHPGGWSAHPKDLRLHSIASKDKSISKPGRHLVFLWRRLRRGGTIRVMTAAHRVRLELLALNGQKVFAVAFVAPPPTIAPAFPPQAPRSAHACRSLERRERCKVAPQGG